MDIGVVKRRVMEGKYKTVFEAAEDMRLVWKNCMKYNPEGTEFHKLGQKLSTKFEEKYAKLCKKHGGSPPAPSRTGRRKSKQGDDEPAARRPSSRSLTPTPAQSRSSDRKSKRARYNEELEDTDDDEFMTSGEEEAYEKRRKKRLTKKIEKKGESMEEGEQEGAHSDASQNQQGEVEGGPIYEIESPPPGHLNCLWYSKEEYRHVLVLEKVLGWKTRPVAKLESCGQIETEEGGESKPPILLARDKLHLIETDDAVKIKEKAIVDTGGEFRKRREISRINPRHCNYIKKIAADQELVRSKKEGSEPRFKLVKSAKEREEVFLVKWRGRSYMHCSWERQCDLERFDQSTQQGAARGKISRFLQNQVMTLGHDWKKVVEDGRNAQSAPAPHTHHSHSHNPGHNKDDSDNPSNKKDLELFEPDQDDYFSPLYLEVDRIVGCDENELDMNVLYRQRALNLRAEQESLAKREKDDDEEEKWLKGVHEDEKAESTDAKEDSSSEKDPDDNGKEEEWDPEDNVRYIVRWKGLLLTEATWEYWIDIKRDFVDEAEDFWLRQKAPSPEEVEEITEDSHPHPKYFKKMKESPIFGVSDKERPVAKLEDDKDDPPETSDEDSGTVFKLRAYQLEGVNWLVWNWYNQRSCILADEVRTSIFHPQSISISMFIHCIFLNFKYCYCFSLVLKMGLGKVRSSHFHFQGVLYPTLFLISHLRLYGLLVSKTIQSIGFLHELQHNPQANIRGPFLIVAPLSLVSQWESEAKVWAPDMNVVVYHGNADARTFLVKNEFYYTDQFETKATAQNLKRNHITKFQMMITTYEVVLKDANVLSKIQ